MSRTYLASLLALVLVGCGYIGTEYGALPADELTTTGDSGAGGADGAGLPPDTGSASDTAAGSDAGAASDTGGSVDTGSPSSTSDADTDDTGSGQGPTGDASADAGADAEPDTAPSEPPDTGSAADTGGPGEAAAGGVFAVTGSLTGLAAGATVVLQNEAGDNLALTANGTFAFSGGLPTGSPYAVTVLTQPSGPSQTCTVTNGTGTVGSTNVTGVAVACATRSFTIGGTVSGLTAGSSVVLDDNGGNALTVSANGSFLFSSSVPSGSAYAVTVQTQPASQSCTVSAGTGTVGAAPVSGVSVTCASGVTVGGTVSGLAPGDTLALEDNGGAQLFLTSNGAFAFPSALQPGAAYDVTIVVNPSIPVAQTCSIAKATGSVGTTNVTSVAITCVTPGFTVGGTLSGLGNGDTVVLEDNAGDNLSLTANGAFAFATPVPSGHAYAVTVSTSPGTPTLQSCAVTGGNGTIATANVTSVVVTCTNDYTIGGTLTGLAVGDTVVLQDNGGDNVPLTANGPFTFPTALASGQPYAVTVLVNPSSPTAQTCAVSMGSGSVGTANVVGPTVTCTSGCGGAPFAGGSGTTASPYLICNATQLAQVASFTSANFKLTATINLGGLSFHTIPALSGTFDGSNFHITNWTYLGDGTDGASSNVGFFQTVSGTVKNLALDGVSVTSGVAYVGGLVGSLAGGGTLNRCSTTSGTLTDTGDVNGNGAWGAGGLVGDDSGTVTQCWSGMTVNGGHAYTAGGLIGYQNSGVVITNDYATGNVSGYWGAGGLTGGCGSGGCGVIFTNCYATGTATALPGNGWGGSNVSSIVGIINGPCTETSSYTDVAGDNGCGTVVTSGALLTQSTFAGWDFTNTWSMGSSGPVLQ